MVSSMSRDTPKTARLTYSKVPRAIQGRMSTSFVPGARSTIPLSARGHSRPEHGTHFHLPGVLRGDARIERLQLVESWEGEIAYWRGRTLDSASFAAFYAVLLRESLVKLSDGKDMAHLVWRSVPLRRGACSSFRWWHDQRWRSRLNSKAAPT